MIMTTPAKGKLLLHTKNNKTPKSYNLDKGSITIGSSLNSNIRIKNTENGNEPVFCELDVKQNGLAWLDNRSKVNPPLLNGIKVKHRALLTNGDKFEVYGRVFEYQNDEIKKRNLVKSDKKSYLPKKRMSVMPNFKMKPSKISVSASKIPVKQIGSVTRPKRRSISVSCTKCLEPSYATQKPRRSEWNTTSSPRMVLSKQLKSWSTGKPKAVEKTPSNSLRRSLFSKKAEEPSSMESMAESSATPGKKTRNSSFTKIEVSPASRTPALSEKTPENVRKSTRKAEMSIGSMEEVQLSPVNNRGAKRPRELSKMSASASKVPNRQIVSVTRPKRRTISVACIDCLEPTQRQRKSHGGTPATPPMLPTEQKTSRSTGKSSAVSKTPRTSLRQTLFKKAQGLDISGPWESSPESTAGSVTKRTPLSAISLGRKSATVNRALSVSTKKAEELDISGPWESSPESIAKSVTERSLSSVTPGMDKSVTKRSLSSVTPGRKSRSPLFTKIEASPGPRTPVTLEKAPESVRKSTRKSKVSLESMEKVEAVNRGAKRPRGPTNTVRVTKKQRLIDPTTETGIIPIDFNSSTSSSEEEEDGEYVSSSDEFYESLQYSESSATVQNNITINIYSKVNVSRINNESTPDLIRFESSSDKPSDSSWSSEVFGTPQDLHKMVRQRTPKSVESHEDQGEETPAKSTQILVLKSPKNDLTNVAGLRKLMATPKVVKSPHNDLTNVSGVGALLKTPKAKIIKVQKSPKNDLTNVAGVKKLLKTPKAQKAPKNDLTNVAGVKKMFKTPKVHKSPKNDLTNVAGVKKLLGDPKVQKSPKNDLTNIAGVKKLLKTPKIQNSPKNDLTNIAGVKALLRTPKPQISPLNDLRRVSGVKKLMKTPKTPKSPLNDLSNISGVWRLVKTPKSQKEPLNDLSNVDDLQVLFDSPERPIVVIDSMEVDEAPKSARGRKAKVQVIEQLRVESPRTSARKRNQVVEILKPNSPPKTRSTRGRKKLVVEIEDADKENALMPSPAPRRGRKKTEKESEEDNEGNTPAPSPAPKRGRKKAVNEMGEAGEPSPAPKRGRKKSEKELEVKEELITPAPSPAPKRGRKKAVIEDDGDVPTPSSAPKRGRKKIEKEIEVTEELATSAPSPAPKRGRKKVEIVEPVEENPKSRCGRKLQSVEETVVAIEELKPKRGGRKRVVAVVDYSEELDSSPEKETIKSKRGTKKSINDDEDVVVVVEEPIKSKRGRNKVQDETSAETEEIPKAKPAARKGRTKLLKSLNSLPPLEVYTEELLDRDETKKETEEKPKRTRKTTKKYEGLQIEDVVVAQGVRATRGATRRKEKI